MDKYRASAHESEILLGLLGLTDATAIGLARFEGCLRADIGLTESLTPTTTRRAKLWAPCAATTTRRGRNSGKAS